jgi:pimeloyl-ACP methyl ester carboxylesterase
MFLARLLLMPFVLVTACSARGPVTEQAGPFKRATLDGIELEYEVRGSGEPVVLVHGGCLADLFGPLMEERALTAKYRVISYHRIGYAGSSRVSGDVSIAQQAAHLRLLLQHLNISRAHIVGHSSGGNIALQLALDAPQTVATLALLEPALPVVASALPGMTASKPFTAIALEQFHADDRAAAIHTFIRGVGGPDYRAVVDRVLPGAFDRAVADAPAFFGQELPAVQRWVFGPDQARTVVPPVLAVIGEKSKEVSPVWPVRQKMLLDWLPASEAFIVPGATHLLPLQNPQAVAERLVAFFAAHPLAVR